MNNGASSSTYTAWVGEWPGKFSHLTSDIRVESGRSVIISGGTFTTVNLRDFKAAKGCVWRNLQLKTKLYGHMDADTCLAESRSFHMLVVNGLISSATNNPKPAAFTATRFFQFRWKWEALSQTFAEIYNIIIENSLRVDDYIVYKLMQYKINRS